MSTMDNKDQIKALLYSYYTTITGWVVLQKVYVGQFSDSLSCAHFASRLFTAFRDVPSSLVEVGPKSGLIWEFPKIRGTFKGGYKGNIRLYTRFGVCQNWGYLTGVPLFRELTMFSRRFRVHWLGSHEIPRLPNGLTQNVQGFLKDSVLVVLGPLLSRSGRV